MDDGLVRLRFDYDNLAFNAKLVRDPNKHAYYVAVVIPTREPSQFIRNVTQELRSRLDS